MGKKESKNIDCLEVYKLAKKLAIDIYQLTRKFPKEELYCITSQIRGCASSVGANIAEGYGRYFYKDQVRFDYMVRGSLFELFY